MNREITTKVTGASLVLIIVVLITGAIAWKVLREQESRKKVAVVKGKQVKASSKKEQLSEQETQDDQSPLPSSQVAGPRRIAGSTSSTSGTDGLPPLLTSPSWVTIVDLRTGRRLTISWQNPSSEVFSFVRIYRSQVLGNPGVLIADNYRKNSFTDSGLIPWISYYYLVRMVDVFGRESGNQNQYQGTPTDATPPSVTASGDIKVDIVPGNLAEILAQVEDEGGIGEVLLYQKPATRENFEESPELMTKTGGDSFKAAYRSTVLASEVAAENIDYYVEAKDNAGNSAADPADAPVESYEISPIEYSPLDQE